MTTPTPCASRCPRDIRAVVQRQYEGELRNHDQIRSAARPLIAPAPDALIAAEAALNAAAKAAFASCVAPAAKRRTIALPQACFHLSPWRFPGGCGDHRDAGGRQHAPRRCPDRRRRRALCGYRGWIVWRGRCGILGHVGLGAASFARARLPAHLRAPYAVNWLGPGPTSSITRCSAVSWSTSWASWNATTGKRNPGPAGLTSRNAWRISLAGTRTCNADPRLYLSRS